jgi:hypothetical protein
VLYIDVISVKANEPVRDTGLSLPFFSDCKEFVELTRGNKNLRYLSSNGTL